MTKSAKKQKKSPDEKDDFIIVGKTPFPRVPPGMKPRAYKYSDIPTEREKWVLNLKYLPVPFDLMHLHLKCGAIKSGWWDGELWKGLRLKPEDIIIAWKRNFDHVL